MAGIYDLLITSNFLSNGGGPQINVEQLDVTSNGTYTAPQGTAYNPVNVNVPAPLGGDVEFIDYDGTVVEAYSKAEFLALTALPNNPTHTGLISQGWNWTLADAKNYLQTEDGLCIGQLYTTDNGRTRLYISLTNPTLLSPKICFHQSTTDGLTIYWGDGTSDTSGSNWYLQHTYNSVGDYVIEIDVTQGTAYLALDNSSYYYVFGYTSSNNTDLQYSCFLEKVEMGNNMTVSSGAFQNCYSLKTITMGQTSYKDSGSLFTNDYALKSITLYSSTNAIVKSNAFQYCYNLAKVSLTNNFYYFGSSAFQYCYSLHKLSIPQSTTTFDSGVFQYCNIEKVKIPTTLTSLGNTVFAYMYSLKSIEFPTTSSPTNFPSSLLQGCQLLTSVTVPSNITKLSSNVFSGNKSLSQVKFLGDITEINSGVFQNCASLKLCDLSKCTSVPSLLNSNAFSGTTARLKIVVPDSLYTTWIGSTTWSAYADYIVKASEV